MAIPGPGRYALIQADDLGDLYSCACERAMLVGGRTFDTANDFTKSAGDFLAALACLTGVQGYEYIPPSNRKSVFPFLCFLS